MAIVEMRQTMQYLKEEKEGRMQVLYTFGLSGYVLVGIGIG
jgi:hypothetical protein